MAGKTSNVSCSCPLYAVLVLTRTNYFNDFNKSLRNSNDSATMTMSSTLHVLGSRRRRCGGGNDDDDSNCEDHLAIFAA
jgi:hypothetical protein